MDTRINHDGTLYISTGTFNDSSALRILADSANIERFEPINLLQLDHEVTLNNQQDKSKECITVKSDRIIPYLPDDIFVNKDALCIKKGDKRVVVKKSEEDVDDKAVAFLTAYFYMNSGLSKSQANKILNALRKLNVKATETTVDKSATKISKKRGRPRKSDK